VQVLRDTFVGPRSAAVTSVPKELLQAAEFREFTFSLVANPIFPALLDSASRVLIIVLDARTPTAGGDALEQTEQSLRTLPGLIGANYLVVNVALKTPGSLFDPVAAAGTVV